MQKVERGARSNQNEKTKRGTIPCAKMLLIRLAGLACDLQEIGAGRVPVVHD